MRFPIGKQVVMPGIRSMSINLLGTAAEAVTRTIQRIRVKATTEERDAQLAICASCERFSQDDGRCSACGCYMSAKAWLLGFCPLGKHPQPPVDTNPK